MSTHDRVRKLVLDKIRELTEQGIPFTSRTIAKWLLQEHPDEVHVFLEDTLESVMTAQISHVVTEFRNRQRSNLGFLREVSQILPSESSARLLYAVDHSGNRKEVSKMTRSDALYVVGLMHARASDQIAIAAWLDHLSKDLGPGEVIGDRYPDQEIDKAYKRLVKQQI